MVRLGEKMTCAVVAPGNLLFLDGDTGRGLAGTDGPEGDFELFPLCSSLVLLEQNGTSRAKEKPSVQTGVWRTLIYILSLGH